jgi:hypothetical protein
VDEETTLFGPDKLDIVTLVDVLTRCSLHVKQLPRKDCARRDLRALQGDVRKMVELLVDEVARRRDFTGCTLPTRTSDRYTSDLTTSSPIVE